MLPLDLILEPCLRQKAMNANKTIGVLADRESVSKTFYGVGARLLEILPIITIFVFPPVSRLRIGGAFSFYNVVFGPFSLKNLINRISTHNLIER